MVSDHDTACTCDRCRMMVMPTTRTAGERVLHEWSFAGYVCRIVETEPGIVHFEQAQGSTIPLAPGRHLAFNRTEKPMGDANEIIQLSLALRDVEAERDRLRGDLADALDLQAGHGPTALASVVMDRDRIRKELEEAEKALREADFLIGGARISDVDRCAFRQMPAVRRALERGK